MVLYYNNHNVILRSVDYRVHTHILYNMAIDRHKIWKISVDGKLLDSAFILDFYNGISLESDNLLWDNLFGNIGLPVLIGFSSRSSSGL